MTDASVTLNGSGVNETLSAPNAAITFSPSATQATTSFNAATNTWNTTLPTSHLSGNAFLDGFGFQVPAGGLPGGINSVTWTASFSTTSAVKINWQWAAAVYTSVTSDNNAAGVKPVDDNHASQYQNSDHAGTPENFESYVIGGARGGGGSNYTGSYSGTAAVTPTVRVAPQTADLSGYVTGGGTPLAGVAVTLTGTDNLGNNVTLTVNTDANGFYDVTTLAPGTYTVDKPNTSGVFLNQSQVGTDNGTTDGSVDARGNIVAIVLAAGDVATDYDFRSFRA